MTGFDLTPLLLLLLLTVAVAHLAAVVHLRRRGDRWPPVRSCWFGAAIAGVLLTAVLPALRNPPNFAWHVAGHLVMMMLCPLAFAMAAPVTLALRVARPPVRRLLLRMLHSAAARVGTAWPVALVLEVGGLYAYYLTPLYRIATGNTVVGMLVHLHMFLVGCLFSAVFVGRDPLPRRPAVRTVLAAVVAAAAAHEVLAKLMYAHVLPAGAGSPDQIRTGAQLLLYGGDAVEILLAVAVMSSWYARGGRRLRQAERRARARVGAPADGPGSRV